MFDPNYIDFRFWLISMIIGIIAILVIKYKEE